MSSRSCPKCGKKVAEDMKFCPYCGITMPEINRCQNCGKELQADMTFCPYCGQSLREKDCPYCGTPLEQDAKYCYHCGLDITAGLVCAECGSKLMEGSVFCPKCGKKYEIHRECEEQEPESGTDKKKCIACGSYVENDAIFCSACGNVVSENAEIAYNHLKWQKAKKVIQLSATKKLSLSEAVLNYADCAVFDCFRYRKIEKELEEKYTEIFPDFKSFMEKAGHYFTDLFFKEVSDACTVLQEKYGIEDVSVNNFFPQSHNCRITFEWANMIETVSEAFFQSIDAIEEAKKYRELTNQPGRQFVGGGIGFGGAIKGMLTAEVLNGIWSGLSSAYNNLQYSRDCSRNKAEAYQFICSESFKERFLDSVCYNLSCIGPVMAEILYYKKGIYCFNPCYADILIAKDAREALKSARECMENKDYGLAQDMIIEALELNPYPNYAGKIKPDKDPREKYYLLFQLFGNDNHQVSDLIQTVCPKDDAVDNCLYVLNEYMKDAGCKSFDEVKTAQGVVENFILGMDITDTEKDYYINNSRRILQTKYL